MLKYIFLFTYQPYVLGLGQTIYTKPSPLDYTMPNASFMIGKFCDYV
jgi:hypothetical protein